MKKSYLIVLILLILLGAWYYKSQYSTKNLTQMMTDKVAQKIANSVELKCEIKNSENNTSVLYMKNKMVKGDTTSNGKLSHMIMKNSQLWSWEEGEAEGMTMVFPIPADAQADDAYLGAYAGATNIGFNLAMLKDASKNSNCKPEKIDDGIFEIPTNVTFRSLTDMMKGLPGASGTTGSPDIQKMINEQLEKAKSMQ